MHTISLSGVSFQYEHSPDPVFTNCSISINTSWRTGIVGRNGRGKSTLLQLIHGSLPPVKGIVQRPVRTGMFPAPVQNGYGITFDAIKQSIAPFQQWEREMETLLRQGDERSLDRYHHLFEHYVSRNGFSIDAEIARECAALGLDEETLQRPWSTLSGGEQTRSMIAVLFLQKESIPLLDEPTNHLDLNGRAALAAYLARKNGFIVVSHDRTFLDDCCDHIVAINKNDLRVFQGNFSLWKQQMALEEATEAARDTALHKEIAALETAARQRRTWSLAAEREKHKAADSGFVSHKAAKVMKRALAAERRIEMHLLEKRSLLLNRETVRPLILHTEHDAPEVVVSLESVTVSFGDTAVLKEFSMTLRRGERVAVIGPNGAGKTTLLNVIRKIQPVTNGIVHVPAAVHVMHAFQTPVWNSGSLRSHLRRERIDETLFRTAMGTFNIQGDIFERPLESFSEGERKKVELCRSCIFPHHLLVWDEPVNYIDIESKEQIESAIRAAQPTMLFVEHDKTFIDTVATRIIHIPALS
jgi:lincosamide and streptogramin A transport system ATP-binding/permease protein